MFPRPHLLYLLVFLFLLLFPLAFSSYFLFISFFLPLLFTALRLLLSSAYSLSYSFSSFPTCYIFSSEKGHTIQGDSEGKLNIFGGAGIGHCEKKSSYEDVSD